MLSNYRLSFVFFSRTHLQQPILPLAVHPNIRQRWHVLNRQQGLVDTLTTRIVGRRWKTMEREERLELVWLDVLGSKTLYWIFLFQRGLTHRGWTIRWSLMVRVKSFFSIWEELMLRLAWSSFSRAANCSCQRLRQQMTNQQHGSMSFEQTIAFALAIMTKI